MSCASRGSRARTGLSTPTRSTLRAGLSCDRRQKGMSGGRSRVAAGPNQGRQRGPGGGGEDGGGGAVDASREDAADVASASAGDLTSDPAGRLAATLDLDLLPTAELLQRIHDEDARVADAV